MSVDEQEAELAKHFLLFFVTHIHIVTKYSCEHTLKDVI